MGPWGPSAPPGVGGLKKKVILRPILFDYKLFETYKYHSLKKSILEKWISKKFAKSRKSIVSERISIGYFEWKCRKLV